MSTYILRGTEEYEFLAKLISSGRITIPETLRETLMLQDEDTVSIKMSIVKKTPSIELYVYDEEKLAKEKAELSEVAKTDYLLSCFHFDRFEVPLDLSVDEEIAYHIETNCIFSLLGAKIVSRKGWGKYELYRASMKEAEFTISDVEKLDDGIWLDNNKVLGKNRFFADDVLRVKRVSGEGTVRIVLLGLSLTPPACIPMQPYKWSE